MCALLHRSRIDCFANCDNLFDKSVIKFAKIDRTLPCAIKFAGTAAHPGLGGQDREAIFPWGRDGVGGGPNAQVRHSAGELLPVFCKESGNDECNSFFPARGWLQFDIFATSSCQKG